MFNKLGFKCIDSILTLNTALIEKYILNCYNILKNCRCPVTFALDDHKVDLQIRSTRGLRAIAAPGLLFICISVAVASVL